MSVWLIIKLEQGQEDKEQGWATSPLQPILPLNKISADLAQQGCFPALSPFLLILLIARNVLASALNTINDQVLIALGC